MEKTTAALALILALFVSLVVGVQSAKSNSKTIIVPDDYSTIQEAINAAIDGDIVFVKRGIYNETLVVNKTISLIGEDREATIIDAQKAYTQVIAIKGNNITVANFTLGNTAHHIPRDSGDSLQVGEGDGIVVYYPSYDVNIINNTIIGCPIIGIYLYACTTINSGNNIHPNVNVIGNNIFLGYTAIQIYTIDCFVVNNTYAKTDYGVKFEYESIIVGIAGGPSNGTLIVLSERNIVQGNRNVTEASTIPSPFPSLSPSSSPTLSPNADNNPYLTACILSGITIITIVSITLFVYFKKRSHAKITDNLLYIVNRWTSRNCILVTTCFSF